MFQCDCCGLCCRNIKGIKLLAPFDDGSGTCVYLDRENNLCAVYGSRPLVCNVDEMYDAFFRDKMMREEFYGLNYDACKKLKRQQKKTEGQ